MTFMKASKVTKLCLDKLYVARILRIKILSSFVMLQELERSSYDPKQQATGKFIHNMNFIIIMLAC